jgi:hypothetical protein
VTEQYDNNDYDLCEYPADLVAEHMAILAHGEPDETGPISLRVPGQDRAATREEIARFRRRCALRRSRRSVPYRSQCLVHRRSRSPRTRRAARTTVTRRGANDGPPGDADPPGSEASTTHISVAGHP